MIQIDNDNILITTKEGKMILVEELLNGIKVTTEGRKPEVFSTNPVGDDYYESILIK